MMEIEKKFATADLSSLKEVPIKLFAKACVQYQDYKTKSAMSRINYKSTGWSESTAIAMFDAANTYIRNGAKSKGINNDLYRAIDEVVASKKYIPLTPSKNDARRILARKHKPTVKVTAQPSTIPVVVNTFKAIQEFLYAVQSNNLFYTFKTEREMNSFIQGVKFANPEADVKTTKISIAED